MTTYKHKYGNYYSKYNHKNHNNNDYNHVNFMRTNNLGHTHNLIRGRGVIDVYNIGCMFD